MAGPWKVIFEFAHPKGGWSEILYNSAGTPQTAYNVARALADLRAQMMGFPTTLEYLRLSDESNPRSASTTSISLGTVGNGYVSGSDKLESSADIRLFSTADTRQRLLYCRGNPDNAYDRQDPNNADAQLFIQKLNAFGNSLSVTINGWLIKTKPRLTKPPVAANWLNVTKWLTTAVSKNTNVELSDITGLAIGDFITFYGVPGLPFPPGLCKIVDIPNAPLTVTVRYRTPADYVYGGAARALKYVPGFSTIDNFNFAKFGKHATGRPFGLARGRRKSIAR